MPPRQALEFESAASGKSRGVMGAGGDQLLDYSQFLLQTSPQDGTRDTLCRWEVRDPEE